MSTTVEDLHEPRVDTAWIATHVFYASNTSPLIDECLGPLVAELREDGAIQGWFFIRYWMEGPHLRFRVKPTPGREGEVRQRVARAVQDFLERRPALYQIKPELAGDMYKSMFLMEYTEEDWERRYGKGNDMPLRDSNTFVEQEYEPEWAKYGGPVGVRISEKHFEVSSDLVLRLLATTNMHVRPVQFGLALQVMSVLISTFLQDPETERLFLRAYQSFWESLLQQLPKKDQFVRTWEKMKDSLDGHLPRLQELCREDQQEELSGFLRDWGTHARDLRHQIEDATARGELLFAGQGDAVRQVERDPARTLWALLVPYVHMTNNRMGVSIVEEIYFAYLLEQQLTLRLEGAS